MNRLGCIAVLFLALTSDAFTQGTISWAFDQTNFVAFPSDTITMSATITSTLDYDFTITGGGRGFGGDLLWYYGWDFGESLFLRTIPAHGTLHFNFGNLIPIGGYVEPGIYYANPADIGFGGGLEGIAPDNTFQITVVPVPEPASVSLILVGILAALIFRRSASSSRGK